jgi:hypothetical protein
MWIPAGVRFRLKRHKSVIGGCFTMKDKFNMQVLRNTDAGENAKPKSATVKLHWYCAILNFGKKMWVILNTK